MVLGRRSGSHSRFCSSEPNSRSGSATPIDWCAESSVDERRVPGAGHRQRAVVVDLREAEAAVLLGHLHAQRAELLEARRSRRRGSWRRARSASGSTSLVEERRAARARNASPFSTAAGSSSGCGMDQVEPEVAEEELLAEARASSSPARGRASATCRASFSLTLLATDDSLGSREYLSGAGVSLNNPPPGDSIVPRRPLHHPSRHRSGRRRRSAIWPPSTPPGRSPAGC